MIHSLKFLCALNPFFSIPFNIIAIIEIFETLPFADVIIRKKDGSLSGKKIFLVRVGLLGLIYLLTLLSSDIAVLFDIVGSFFGPIVGFIIPVR